ncbi:radical SAM protein [bacterium]|nr:radical SAM protein [bacterium]
MKKKNIPTVILLNPPAKEIAIRDNYCSKISQAAYINHPIDLLFQSGFLYKNFNLVVIDAVVEKKSIEFCIEEILNSQAKYVFSLAGNATWPEDVAFFQALKKNMPEIKLAVSGDIFLENPVKILETITSIDAIFLDYTGNGLLKYFSKISGPYDNLVFRDESGQIHDHRIPRTINGEMRIPLPVHEPFFKLDYRYPFVRNRHFATVMTEFGCPFHCAFCVMGTLGCKRRPIQDVLEEIKLIKGYGIRDIFFLDQSFGSDRNRNLTLCHEITQKFPRLRWVCFSRVDLVDEEILTAMKKAGCHTIIFGVETASSKLLKQYRKGYDLNQVKQIFRQARRTGIRTVATFLLGLPGETRESALKTIEFAQRLPCSYASLNVAVPRMGTDLRQWALEKGFVNPETTHFDQSGSNVIMATDALTSDELAELKRIAVRKLYLNPGKIIRIISSLRSWDEIHIHFVEGYHLLRRFAGLKS